MALSDSHLLDSARKHELQAWDTLLKRHQLPLFTYIAELIRDDSSALDLVQETFAAAVRHIATLRDDTRFGSWLFGIAHQKCIQHWRRSRRDETVFAFNAADDEALDVPHGSSDSDPRTQLLQQERAEEFFVLVECLSPPQRSVLLLHVLEDFSLEEIAKITDVPLGTVKSRLHHAKRALRHLVEARR